MVREVAHLGVQLLVAERAERSTGVRLRPDRERADDRPMAEIRFIAVERTDLLGNSQGEYLDEAGRWGPIATPSAQP